MFKSCGLAAARYPPSSLPPRPVLAALYSIRPPADSNNSDISDSEPLSTPSVHLLILTTPISPTLSLSLLHPSTCWF
ncbi:hypothetical protein RRG08_061720 [Elysia crispata]|uniref:Uncharacterized protein n=1 Tax=Elysia crispata TaxID=231223 RepID=A0AAE0ZXA4_9GAST|nr:hypothetical protein RRG08_061720 [Elysia crispata]